jgi:hypothetical protein
VSASGRALVETQCPLLADRGRIVGINSLSGIVRAIHRVCRQEHRERRRRDRSRYFRRSREIPQMPTVQEEVDCEDSMFGGNARAHAVRQCAQWIQQGTLSAYGVMILRPWHVPDYMSASRKAFGHPYWLQLAGSRTQALDRTAGALADAIALLTSIASHQPGILYNYCARSSALM